MIRERSNKLLHFLDRWAGIPLTVPAAFWRKLSKKAASDFTPTSIGIFCPGAAGDLLLLSALTAALRAKFPDCKIEILATSANAGVLPLNPHADYTSSWPLGRPDRLIAYIRSRSYDIFLDSSQWARFGNLVANFSGAKITAGFSTQGQYRSLGYDKICVHNSSCHEVENFLNLGRSLWPDLMGKPCLIIPQSKQSHIAPAIYCHMWTSPGKGKRFKEWPQKLWAELIRALLARDFEIRLTGSNDDVAQSQAFVEHFFPDNKKICSIAGQTTWPALAALLARAQAVISVNTGVLHLAAMTGAPTIGLHGATNPLRWGPIGPHVVSLLPEAGDFAYLNLGFEYPKNAEPAMQRISVAAVLSALEKLDVIS